MTKPYIVSTPQRTDGMKWMIRFGWVERSMAEKHMRRCAALGERVGLMINRDDWCDGVACPLVWTKDLPRAVEIASHFPLAA